MMVMHLLWHVQVCSQSANCIWECSCLFVDVVLRRTLGRKEMPRNCKSSSSQFVRLDLICDLKT
jgi:hypothetical protein